MIIMKVFFQQDVIRLIAIVLWVVLTASCSKKTNPSVTPPPPPVVTESDVSLWITTGSQASLLAKQNVSLVFGTSANTFSTISVDSFVKYQSMAGFGHTLTGGSALLISGLSTATRATLLKELFSVDTASMGVSYLRVSIGASDLS